MTMNYFLAPNGRWSARDLVGDAAVDGYVKTFKAGTTEPKITWEDPAGANPNPVIVPLDAAGEANIYWGYDVDDPFLYYIEVYDKDDNLVYSQDDYPTLSTTNADGSLKPQINNFVRNPQFTYWSNSTNYPTISSSQNDYDYVADEWTFERNNTTAIVNVSQQLFLIGQQTVPANPIGYLHYECGNATSASETYKRFKQIYKSVQTLSGQNIAFDFWAKSDTGSSVSINIQQVYGTGGTPSATVTTNVLVANLTSAWHRYKALITLPVAAGTLGSNNDDHISLCIDLPLNAFSSTLDACDLQLKACDQTTDFIINSQEQSYLSMQNLISQSLFKTGSFRQTLTNVYAPGWVLCDDGTLGNAASNATHAFLSTQALYSVIWNKVVNAYAPIFNSDGTVGTRGASATADYNANKSLSLTKTLGRVLATTGTATLSETFTAYASLTFTRDSNSLLLANVNGFYTGNPIVFTTTGTLPAPLALATTYYVIEEDSTHIKVATTLANATAGTFITLTDAGSGVHTVYQAGAIAVADSSSFYTGVPVTLTTTGTLPAPLVIATTYYVINLGPTYIALATSVDNALNAISIVLTTAGTAIQTMAISYEGWTPGQYTGEFTHNITGSELPAIGIPPIKGNPNATFAVEVPDGEGQGFAFDQSSGPTNSGIHAFSAGPIGDGVPMNITQPTTFVYTQIKL